MDVIVIESAAYKKLISQVGEMRQMIITLIDKVDRLSKKKEAEVKPEFCSIDEMAAEIKKSRQTVKNYLKENPQISRKKDGEKMNLLHREQFLLAFSKGRNSPFIAEVMNRGKQA